MLDDLSKTLMNVVYAGVGAVSLVADRPARRARSWWSAARRPWNRWASTARSCSANARRTPSAAGTERMDGRLSAMSAQEREALRRRLDQLDELDRQAAECAEADARSAEITEIHGGPQERSDNDGE